MANVEVVVLLLVLVGSALFFVNRRRASFIPQRGTSIGADLGALSDQPRVRIREVSLTEPGRVRLVLTPVTPPVDSSTHTASSDLDTVVSLREGELEQLQAWQQAASVLAVVIPPGSRLLRLRSIDDLQPLTLRRVDEP